MPPAHLQAPPVLPQLLHNLRGPLQRLPPRHRHIHATGSGGIVSDERWGNREGGNAATALLIG